ncbi:MAG: cupin domain-containing protein [Pseudomonadales bacterium]|nr:cupin domain-containing protein [Pseudomonadales bacterium]MCP5184030.1 cupin domain-containing protein [Pseudomonadales bacterium]
MAAQPLIRTPADAGKRLHVLGVTVDVLASPDETGDVQITRQSGPADAGPPPHSHGWDESFYITRGEVIFTCAGETSVCGTGSLVFVPAGTIHAFKFGADGGEMLEYTGRRSNAIAMFTAVDREVPPGPPDLEKAVQVLHDHGVTVHG